MAANPSSVELAAARSRSISLEAELESARADARKSERRIRGAVVQRAMSSARRRTKITQLQEQARSSRRESSHLDALVAEFGVGNIRGRRREVPRGTAALEAEKQGARGGVRVAGGAV